MWNLRLYEFIFFWWTAFFQRIPPWIRRKHISRLRFEISNRILLYSVYKIKNLFDTNLKTLRDIMSTICQILNSNLLFIIAFSQIIIRNIKRRKRHKIQRYMAPIHFFYKHFWYLASSLQKFMNFGFICFSCRDPKISFQENLLKNVISKLNTINIVQNKQKSYRNNPSKNHDSHTFFRD